MINKEYMNSLIYGLKDYTKTYEKYCNYKKDKFNDILKNNKDEIKDHLKGLFEMVEYSINTYGYVNSLNLTKKSNIRQLKTFINNITFDENSKFISTLSNELTANEKRTFAIKFYLEYYDKINKTMHKLLVFKQKEYKEVTNE